MRSALRLLLAFAVLLCGVHLSPAEFDAPSLNAHASTLHLSSLNDHTSDHSLPHAAHGCHNHCPVSPGLPVGEIAPQQFASLALHFAAEVTELKPFAEAPLLQPPAA